MVGWIRTGRNTDWTYGNDSPNAIGHNITTEQDPDMRG